MHIAQTTVTPNNLNVMLFVGAVTLKKIALEKN